MTHLPIRACAGLLLAAGLTLSGTGAVLFAQVSEPPTAASAAPADVEVRTALNQTAIWVGQEVTFTIALSCRPGVDVLQEDLGADSLTLVGFQVMGHGVTRTVATDGRIRYDVVYRLTTYDPAIESLEIGDLTVRYAVGASVQRAGAPASELRVPGAVVALRSVLPADLKALDLRTTRGVEPVPASWRASRQAAGALVVVSVVTLGWLLVTWLSAGRPAKPRTRVKREARRDLLIGIGALRHADLASDASRLEAFTNLEALVRRHAASVTTQPAALTAAELQARLADGPAAASAETLGRILEVCEQARYRPLARLPDAERFRATLDEATQVLAESR